MKAYYLKDTTPYSKLKQNNIVFELQTKNDFEQAIIDNEGEIFVEDTKVYLLTKNNKCYVLFYNDKKPIIKIVNARMDGVWDNEHIRTINK